MLTALYCVNQRKFWVHIPRDEDAFIFQSAHLNANEIVHLFYSEKHVSLFKFLVIALQVLDLIYCSITLVHYRTLNTIISYGF